MTVYIPLIIAICSALVFMLQGVPRIQDNINKERKIYEDAKAAVEAARTSESNLAVRTKQVYEINLPYAEFNSRWGSAATTLGRPEEVSRTIVREAQQLGLRISNSRLQDPVMVNTLEGPIQTRQFNVSVEGSHSAIGQWIARCESLIKSVRVVSAVWFPFGSEVQADIIFQLLDDDNLLASTAPPLTLPSWLQVTPAPDGTQGVPADASTETSTPAQ